MKLSAYAFIGCSRYTNEVFLHLPMKPPLIHHMLESLHLIVRAPLVSTGNKLRTDRLYWFPLIHHMLESLHLIVRASSHLYQQETNWGRIDFTGSSFICLGHRPEWQTWHGMVLGISLMWCILALIRRDRPEHGHDLLEVSSRQIQQGWSSRQVQLIQPFLLVSSRQIHPVKSTHS